MGAVVHGGGKGAVEGEEDAEKSEKEAAAKEKREERKLALMMMSKKRRRLYDKVGEPDTLATGRLRVLLISHCCTQIVHLKKRKSAKARELTRRRQQIDTQKTRTTHA